MRAYRISEVRGDRFGGSWPEERFAARGGIFYRAAELNRSELYLEFLPALTASRCRLPNSMKLRKQLMGLERKTSRVGWDTVDHGVGSHDDLSNVVAGVVVKVLKANGVMGTHGLISFFRKLSTGEIKLADDRWLGSRNKPQPQDNVSTETRQCSRLQRRVASASGEC